MLDTLHHWLNSRLDDKARMWLDTRLQQVRQPFKDADLYIAFGLMPRKLGKSMLALNRDELARVSILRPGWQPELWSLADMGRVLLLLTAMPQDHLSLTERLCDLATNADIGEHISIYRGLAIYPHPEAHIALAAEGMRTNMQAVFNAVALDNPYPHDYFDQAQWDQMVLKALFIGSPLHRIIGLDERANPELALMLHDFLHERLSAGREVSPELWRCMGPHANMDMLDDMRNALSHPNPLQRQAAALALSACPLPAAADILATAPEEQRAIRQNELNWQSLSNALTQGVNP